MPYSIPPAPGEHIRCDEAFNHAGCNVLSWLLDCSLTCKSPHRQSSSCSYWQIAELAPPQLLPCLVFYFPSDDITSLVCHSLCLWLLVLSCHQSPFNLQDLFFSFELTASLWFSHLSPTSATLCTAALIATQQCSSSSSNEDKDNDNDIIELTDDEDEEQWTADMVLGSVWDIELDLNSPLPSPLPSLAHEHAWTPAIIVQMHTWGESTMGYQADHTCPLPPSTSPTTHHLLTIECGMVRDAWELMTAAHHTVVISIPICTHWEFC